MRRRVTAALIAASMVLASSEAFAQDRPTQPEKEEERRPQWLYLSTEAGAQRAGMNAFLIDEDSGNAGFRDTSATGPMLGIGAGVRLFVLTLGPRARFALLDRYDVITAGGELGLRGPFGIFEPHLSLGGGYAAVSQLESPSTGRELSADGYYGRVAGGLDVHVTRAVTVGGVASWEAFGVTPEGISMATVDEVERHAAAGDVRAAETKIRRAEGAGYGSAISLGVTLGLHY